MGITMKYNGDGSIKRYKVRLIVKGFAHTYGIDCQEPFEPVAKLNTIRVLLSFATNLNISLQQLDVNNVFLNSELEEEVYMTLPLRFERKFGSGKVCRLKKSFYRLKQAPRTWLDKFSKSIRSHRYSQSQANHALFYNHSSDGKLAIVIVHVDDIILIGDLTELERSKYFSAKEFEIYDLGTLRYFLGMEFVISKEDIFVSQRKNTLDLLKETRLLRCKPVETPIDFTYKLRILKENKCVD